MKLKRGKYLPTTRRVKLIQLELQSLNRKLKNLIDTIQRMELESKALNNSIKKGE